MAQNVTIAGASYTDVPSIVVPKTGGGTASFTDVSPTTAVAEDVANGKIFYLADGTQSVGASSGGGGSTSGVYTFDFTKGVTDQETNLLVFTLTNATQDSSGLHIGAVNARADLNNINLYDHVVEVEVGELDIQFSGKHGRFVMSTYSTGLIYRSGATWEVYGNPWTAPAVPITDPDYFANSVIRIEYPSSGNYVAIYKDGVQLFSNVKFATGDLNKSIKFGSDQTAYYNATIKKCTIYTNAAYALKVLLGG